MDYSNTKIYKLVSYESDDVYYGSTCSTLSKRFSGHKCDYKRWLNGNGAYITSFELVKYNDCQIVLVESVQCKTKDETKAFERKWIENNACVNKYIPGRSREEYRNDNKETKAKTDKLYQERNHEKLTEYYSKYYKDNKERFAGRERQYREDNRERMSEYQTQYRKDNKEIIAERSKIKIQCVCGSNYTRQHKTRHEKSKKHLLYMLSIAKSEHSYYSDEE
jgi:hypothetical protein